MLFTAVPESTETNGHKLYMCNVCRKGLANAVKVCSCTCVLLQCACIAKCGHVLCGECVDRFVKTDKTCPQCSTPVDVTEILYLQTGGIHYNYNMTSRYRLLRTQ